MKHKYLIKFYRLFKPNYYLVRTVKSNKTIKEGIAECKYFALHKHILKFKDIAFKVKQLS